MRPYLLAAVDAVLAEDGRASCGHPHAGQRVAVNLVLLDHALALLVLGHAKRKKKKKRESAVSLTRAARLDRCRRPSSPSTHHVDSAVLPVVDLVVPYDGAAVGSDLDAGQGVAVDVVALYQAPAVPEDVHAALVAVEYGVSAGRKTERLKVSK